MSSHNSHCQFSIAKIRIISVLRKFRNDFFAMTRILWRNMCRKRHPSGCRAGAKVVSFGLDGSIVDGISDVYENESQSSLSSSSSSYNLAGQRVGKDYRGIVIQHGRKVLVK